MKVDIVKDIVFTPDVEDSNLIKWAKEQGMNCHLFLDSRSAVYGATGISAQNGDVVVVCVNGSNDSRSAFSGMTEAYYRKLPIILVTIGRILDYSVELDDVVERHYVVKNENELEKLICSDILLPAHIEMDAMNYNMVKTECNEVQNMLAEILTSDDYLYLGSDIKIAEVRFQCKTVQGGTDNCCDGALANVLGASLAKIHDRYIGLVTEKEFKRDMNTLGNINVNDSLIYIVVSQSYNALIHDYAESLGFVVDYVNCRDIKKCNFEYIIRNKKKSLIVLEGIEYK